MATEDSKWKNVVVSDHRTNNDDDEKHSETDLCLSMDKLIIVPKKKLLVLPFGGFIVHRSHRRGRSGVPANRLPDLAYWNFLIYKRPFCEGFLKFCLERFEVGIWSSAMEGNMHDILSKIMGEQKNRLLFIWDQHECTDTKFMCLKNKEKPLFVKELKYIWKKRYFDLPWQNGDYSSANTLLITDPVKALTNPPNTAIFPEDYDPDNKDDDFLGPEGKLRDFLHGVAEAEDVQTYVKNNPFGKPEITPSHPEWDYYSKIVRSIEKLNLSHKKKLLVLPLSGIIVHRAHRSRPNTFLKNRVPDFSYGNFLVYKRPFCEDFLRFCLDRFQVGLWSSALEGNIDKVLNNVLGEHKSKLLFTWDQKQCTFTGFKCLDKKDKPLFLKELKHLWENKYSTLPWSKGDYSASNTLLITDPVKTLLNPPNTAIFPRNYDPENKKDDFLGPNGELRLFLSGLAEATDVPTYVKDHPIGEPAITPSDPDWDYYSKVIRSMGKKESNAHKK